MRAGPLRHVIWADEPLVAQDETGAEVVTTWVPRLQMHCSIEPISGREALRSGQTLADMDTRITVRWSRAAAAISSKWRLRFVRNLGAGPVETIYNIARPPAEKALGRAEIEFMCSSGLNRG